MRIQHNIAAMNSYRNFSANTSKLSKNLEKLSTGYKINRAGDDAAGLAISEKMRAQITGLDGATRNAKDGISLVQTAEGALTEVHDMLNRMVTLAEQSANGTYDDSLDRDQLQKEVTQLKSEIDRIADSTNYNGIKLLDGSLSGGGSLQGNIRLNNTEAKAAEVTTSAFLATTTRTSASSAKDSFSYSISFTDSNGKEQNETFSFHFSEQQDKLVSDYDGTQYAITSSANITDGELANAVLGEVQKNKNISNNFDVKLESTNALNFKSKVKGESGAVVNSTDTKFIEYTTGVVTQKGADAINRKCNPVDEFQKLDFSNIKVLNKTNLTNSGDVANAVKMNTFTIDGQKAVLVGNDSTLDDMKELIGDDVHIIKLTQVAGSSSALTGTGFSTTAAANANDSKAIAAELSRLSGREFKSASGTSPENDAGITTGEIYLKGDKVSMAGKSLDLQIGDTSDSFNKLSVSVQDMHVEAMGIADVNIGSQEGASAAMDKIKAAVNYVSDTRGSLGALQNRLDHTINNLGVMKENITSSESLIRDTDVAEEMTTYTKNNILNQAAQAMLAQANQLPQGVLQLLG